MHQQHNNPFSDTHLRGSTYIVIYIVIYGAAKDTFLLRDGDGVVLDTCERACRSYNLSPLRNHDDLRTFVQNQSSLEFLNFTFNFFISLKQK